MTEKTTLKEAELNLVHQNAGEIVEIHANNFKW